MASARARLVKGRARVHETSVVKDDTVTRTESEFQLEFGSQENRGEGAGGTIELDDLVVTEA